MKILETCSFQDTKYPDSRSTFILFESNSLFGKSYRIEKENNLAYKTSYNSYDEAMEVWKYMKRRIPILSRKWEIYNHYHSLYNKINKNPYNVLLTSFAESSDLFMEVSKITYFFLLKDLEIFHQIPNDYRKKEKSNLPKWLLPTIDYFMGHNANVKMGLKIEIIKNQKVNVFYKFHKNKPELVDTIQEVDDMELIVTYGAGISLVQSEYFDHNSYWMK